MNEREFIEDVNEFIAKVAHEFFKREGVLSTREACGLERLRDSVVNILDMNQFISTYNDMRNDWLKDQEVES